MKQVTLKSLPNKKIELRPVDRNNWEQCVEIELDEGQVDFVPAPLRCIAEVQFYPESKLDAVYLDGRVIGIVTYGKPINESMGKIFRLIIDRRWQGKGIGRTVVEMVADTLREFEKIEICYHPENNAARNLYQSVGFEEDRTEKVAHTGATKVIAYYARK